MSAWLTCGHGEAFPLTRCQFKLFMEDVTCGLRSPEASHGTGPGSDLRHASIDGEIHAGDEGTFIRCEERYGSRDFLWLAPATHGDL